MCHCSVCPGQKRKWTVMMRRKIEVVIRVATNDKGDEDEEEMEEEDVDTVFEELEQNIPTLPWPGRENKRLLAQARECLEYRK